MTDSPFILGHVEACTNGILPFSDCSAVWELGIIGVFLVAAVLLLVVLADRSYTNYTEVSNSGQAKSLRDPDVVRTNSKSFLAFGYWKCNTPAGTAYIRLRDGRWQALLQNERLGIYCTPKEALDGLLRDDRPILHGMRPSDLDLPPTLWEWEFVREL